jgi:tetratricopeptide (TPR) repeat protein
VPAEDDFVTNPAERREQRRATEAAINRMANGSAMRAAIGHLLGGRPADAEAAVRRQLAQRADDVAALCLLGDIAARGGIHAEAERLFRLALSHAPLFSDAQVNLARILALRDAVPEAITLLQDVITDEPERWPVALQRLALLGQIGDYELAALGYERLLINHPGRAEVWCGFGHLQKTLGNVNRSIEAYRRAITLDEKQGDAWWGLANLKTYRFDDDDVAHLERLALAGDAAPFVRSVVNFALGKALEDKREFARSFRHYAAGNELRRRQVHYDAAATSAETARSIVFFTREVFNRGDGAGHPAADPIFILGLPRSGSTLVEQILASHSQVEGTAELPYIPMLVHRLLAERWQERSLTFPGVLDGIPTDRLYELGQAYLDAASVHRRDGTPFFIDKLPNNWAYVGFIRLILPNAKIVDARREPLACGWSNYKQWFARGQEFSYDLSDIGRYYRDYLALMDHVDRVQPGAVRRVIHEELISDPVNEISRLLDDLRLPFEESCLTFHQNGRPVRTASAEQVRRPINRDATAAWQAYEQWLGPLKTALKD